MFLPCSVDGCNYVAQRESRLKCHIKFHHGAAEHRCSVPGCEHTAKTKTRLKRHIMCCHGDGERVKCPNCGRSLKNSRSLTTHLGVTCGKEPTFLCSVPGCKYFSKTQAKLERHIMCCHGDDEQVKCPNVLWKVLQECKLTRHPSAGILREGADDSLLHAWMQIRQQDAGGT